MDLIFGDASGIVIVSIRLVIWEIIIKSCYKMKNDAMKRTAGRPRSQIDHNLKGKRTVEIITEETGESPKQVQRYCCLPIITIGIIDYRHCNQKNLKIYLSTLHKSV